ncbi:MAG TPA: hypoxanthine phosphoribosyltransferase [Actinomycetota bacterium]|nr:hypoxanthine phosphoribosyltransferase [Actinomycetota bacterium]
MNRRSDEVIEGHFSSNLAAELLIDRATIARRIGELGTDLAQIFGGGQPPVLVGVLKGSAMFLADLIRAMDIDVVVDFMSISSYSQSGVVRIIKDLDEDIRGRDVVIVEDIVDTGLSLNYLRKTLTQREPTSMRAVTLLNKTARRIIPVPLEFSAFEIPDVFVVGYGLDFQGLYRNAADILAVRDLARLANDPRLLVTQLFGLKNG